MAPRGTETIPLGPWLAAPASPNWMGSINALGLGALDLEAVVPHRRLVDLARYGMAANE